MSDTFIKLKAHQKLLSKHVISHSNGNDIVVEVIQNSPISIIIAQTEIDKNSKIAVRTNSCGYCEGVFIGCVDCPHNDPYLNCVTKTITCDS